MIKFNDKEWRFSEIYKTVHSRLDQDHLSVRYAVKAKVAVRDIEPVVNL